MDERDLQLADIYRARLRIREHTVQTPLIFSQGLSERTGSEIYLKLECWQQGGCFKVRGATNMVAALNPEERARGVVTASSGNHGLAVARAARIFDCASATIFLPKDADRTKVEKIRHWGPDVVFHGRGYLEAYGRARRYAAERDAIYVHSHAHPLIIAGQGTIGLEIIEALPDMEAVLVPVGGGGLISGIATAIKAASPGVEVVGVEPSAAPAAYRSLQDDVCYEEIDVAPSIADGLLGGFGQLPFKISRELVSKVVLVEDEEIIQAMRVFQRDEQLLVEAAAAVGLAALLGGKVNLERRRVVLVVTSRNIDSGKYNRLIRGSG